MRIGVDIGGVIIKDWQLLPFALDGLADLMQLTDGQVYLVSKCGPTMQTQTMDFLTDGDFWRRTGIFPGQAIFCRQWVDKQVIAEQLQLTDFIDDRLEVLEFMRHLPMTKYLFGQKNGPDWVQPVETWTDVSQSVGAQQ